MHMEYPPWWIEKAALRKTELDAGVTRLRVLLPALPNVRGALLFGSYATNTVGPESDLDVMLVQHTSKSMLQRGTELRQALFDALRVPYDLVVYTPEEYERFSREIPFVAQARREGIWLTGGSE